MLTVTPQIEKTTSQAPQSLSLENFLSHPPEHIEWIDGQLIEKTGITLRHSQIQLRLGSDWRNYAISSGQGGEVYTSWPDSASL
jgi:Uma2 family endonuclease